MDILLQIWIAGVVLTVLVALLTFTPLGKALTRGGPWPVLPEKPEPIGEGLIWLFWVAVFLLISFLFWYFRS